MSKKESYVNRGPKTNRPNVDGPILSFRFKSPQEIFNAIKKGTKQRRKLTSDLSTYDPETDFAIGDQMPDYSEILTDVQIWDLVKFIKEGYLDVTLLYDATYTGTYPTEKATYNNIGKDGNYQNGLAIYQAKCEVCPGVDGKN